MVRSVFASVLILSAALVLGSHQPVSAQGLIWSLPEDGTWVRYEGTYTQTSFRPDSTPSEVTMNWIRHLTLKSVGTESAEFRGETVPCRWIEVEIVTGTASEMGLDPGPAGTRLYKVLIPEQAVPGSLVDEQNIFISYLPIVGGFRKTGDGPVEEIQSNVLQVYPAVSLLMHYQQWESASEQAEPLDIPLGTVSARRHTAERRMESYSNRVQNAATLWRSDGVPFGLAQWQVTVTRAIKNRAESRDAFEKTNEVRVEMAAHEAGQDAVAKIRQGTADFSAE